MASWERLPDSLKESNRAFAERIGHKLDEAGCALVPNPFAPLDADGFQFAPSEIEDLAKLEHRQWCEALMHDGWRRGPVKDPSQRIHPLLVPWDELSEREREKDRAPVRALSELVARVGFEIVSVRDPRRLS